MTAHTVRAAPSGEREARSAAPPGGPPNPVAPGPGPDPSPAMPRLHVPDEPTDRRESWRAAVLDGAPLGEVVAGPGGVSSWLWARWSVLASAGVDEARFDELAAAYAREIWLWLVGDRTWAQCCAGLIGRVGRRLPRGAAR